MSLVSGPAEQHILTASEYLDLINKDFKFKNDTDMGSALEFLTKLNSVYLQNPYHEYHQKFTPAEFTTAEENDEETHTTAIEYLSQMNASFSYTPLASIKATEPEPRTTINILEIKPQKKKSNWKKFKSKISKKSRKKEALASTDISDGDYSVGSETTAASEYLRTMNGSLTFVVKEVKPKEDLVLNKKHKTPWKRIKNLAKKMKGTKGKRGRKEAIQ